jgi:hypothetical protein
MDGKQWMMMAFRGFLLPFGWILVGKKGKMKKVQAMVAIF